MAETKRMTDVTRAPAGASLALLLNRLSLGAYFLLAGYSKVFKVGVEEFYEGPFQSLKPEWLPEWFAYPFGYALPFTEMLFGALLVIGLLTRVSAMVLFLLLVGITIALAENGVFLYNPPQVPGPFHTNVILGTLALALVFLGPGGLSLDRIIRWQQSRKRAKRYDTE